MALNPLVVYVLFMDTHREIPGRFDWFIVTAPLTPKDTRDFPQDTNGYVGHLGDPLFRALWFKGEDPAPGEPEPGETYRHEALDITLHEIEFAENRPLALDRFLSDACAAIAEWRGDIIS